MNADLMVGKYFVLAVKQILLCLKFWLLQQTVKGTPETVGLKPFIRNEETEDLG